MRRYDDPVEVRRGLVTGVEGPEQFLWRGRLWKVRAVLAHWVETGAWWQSSGVRAVVGSDDPVRRGATPGATCAAAPAGTCSPSASSGGSRPAAVPGRRPVTASPAAGGVFDLSFDWTDGRWQLVGCVD